MDFDQKLKILASSEERDTVEACRKYGVSTIILYNCKKKDKHLLTDSQAQKDTPKKKSANLKKETRI